MRCSPSGFISPVLSVSRRCLLSQPCGCGADTHFIESAWCLGVLKTKIHAPHAEPQLMWEVCLF